LLSAFEDLGVHQVSNSPSGSPLGSVWVHSLTLSYTPGSMKCDSWASILAHTFVSPCLGRKPKARVAIINVQGIAKLSPTKWKCKNIHHLGRLVRGSKVITF